MKSEYDFEQRFFFLETIFFWSTTAMTLELRSILFFEWFDWSERDAKAKIDLFWNTIDNVLDFSECT